MLWGYTPACSFRYWHRRLYRATQSEYYGFITQFLINLFPKETMSDSGYVQTRACIYAKTLLRYCNWEIQINYSLLLTGLCNVTQWAVIATLSECNCVWQTSSGCSWTLDRPLWSLAWWREVAVTHNVNTGWRASDSHTATTHSTGSTTRTLHTCSQRSVVHVNYYDPEIHEEYLIHDTPLLLPHHL